MRTTISLAPDVADRVAQLARNSKRSMNAVLNDLVRAGLQSDPPASPVKYQVRTFDLGIAPCPDSKSPSQILFELEQADYDRP